MSFDLSFSPEFFGDIYEPKVSNRPCTLADSVTSMQVLKPERWAEMGKELFGLEDGMHLSVDSVFSLALETDSCATLKSPVEVYIDPEGYYSVLVYDRLEDRR